MCLEYDAVMPLPLFIICGCLLTWMLFVSRWSTQHLWHSSRPCGQNIQLLIMISPGQPGNPGEMQLSSSSDISKHCTGGCRRSCCCCWSFCCCCCAAAATAANSAAVHRRCGMQQFNCSAESVDHDYVRCLSAGLS